MLISDFFFLFASLLKPKLLVTIIMVIVLFISLSIPSVFSSFPLPKSQKAKTPYTFFLCSMRFSHLNTGYELWSFYVLNECESINYSNQPLSKVVKYNDLSRLKNIIPNCNFGSCSFLNLWFWSSWLLIETFVLFSFIN